MSLLAPLPPPETLTSDNLTAWSNHLEEMGQRLQAVDLVPNMSFAPKPKRVRRMVTRAWTLGCRPRR